MNTLEIWLLSVALAMDCFSVSIASSAMLRCIRWGTLLTMAFFFGLFQALMPCIGWLLTSQFEAWIESFDHWIAFGLLLYLGVSMIRESFCGEEKKSFNPTRLKVILTLSVATSIDALAVGISFACTGMNTLRSILFPIFAIGVGSFVFSCAGHLIGVFFGKRYDFKAELLGGVVLICIGVKILLTHLME